MSRKPSVSDDIENHSMEGKSSKTHHLSDGGFQCVAYPYPKLLQVVFEHAQNFPAIETESKQSLPPSIY